MVFADSRGACLYWGPDRIAIYNEGFAVTAEGAHPFLMGHGFAEAFPELAPNIEPVFELAATTGQAVNVDDIQLFVNGTITLRRPISSDSSFPFAEAMAKSQGSTILHSNLRRR